MTATIVTFLSDPETVTKAISALRVQTLDVHVALHANTPGHNLGFAGGHNMLLAEAFAGGAELVVVHNPDLTLAPDAVDRLAAAARAQPLALFGPVLERADGDLNPSALADSLGIVWTRDARHLDEGHGLPLPPWLPEPGTTGRSVTLRRVAGISGACLAVPRAAYDRVVAASGEFFDEDFIAYREDAELAIRAGVLGIESWLVPAARGLHVRTQRGTVRGRDVVIDMLGVRNRFLILAKWGRRRPGWLACALFRDGVVIAGVLLRERSSLPGLVQAWRLRRKMRAKRERVLAWARANPPPGP